MDSNLRYQAGFVCASISDHHLLLAGSHQTIPDDLENTANLASWLEAQGRGAVQGVVEKTPGGLGQYSLFHVDKLDWHQNPTR